MNNFQIKQTSDRLIYDFQIRFYIEYKILHLNITLSQKALKTLQILKPTFS